MAKHGVLLERDNFITECQIRAGIAAIDLDGGALVVEGAPVAGERECHTLAAPTAADTRVAIAFNPDVFRDVIGGNRFPGQSEDGRNYYNIAGDVVGYFFPVTGIEFGVQMANIEGAVEPVVGQFLEKTAGSNTFTIAAAQTADQPSFEVIEITSYDYPTGGLDDDAEKVFIVKTRFNG